MRAAAADAARASPATATLSQLSTIVLPEPLGLKRDFVLPEEERGPGYDAGYDRTTLAYDVLALPEVGIVRLFCPKLLNLEAAVRRAAFSLDGVAVPLVRVARLKRHDTIDLATSHAAERLTIALDCWSETVPVRHRDHGFAGLNCILALSRDNDLRWIADWARFNVEVHGAQACLLFDNGSTRYGLDALERALAPAKTGLRMVRIVPIERPYGPQGVHKHRGAGKYLQLALLDVARQRFLAEARAVLLSDIDELVIGTPSVFDAAVGRRAGYVSIPGAWRFPRPGTGPVALHRDHMVRPEKKLRCPPKYCIVPSGRASRHPWGVHRIDALWLGFLHRTRRHRLIHCQGVSTFWKAPGKRPDAAGGGIDEEAEALLERVFGENKTTPQKR